MRWLILLPLAGCAATQTIVRVADPTQVSLKDDEGLFAFIPARSAAPLEHVLKPGMKAVRGLHGELSLSCAILPDDRVGPWRPEHVKCNVDDGDASGVWLSADGVTEGLDVDARALASLLTHEGVLIPVIGVRHIWSGKHSDYDLFYAAMATPSSNVTQIIERTSVARGTRKADPLLLVGGVAALALGVTTLDLSRAPFQPSGHSDGVGVVVGAAFGAMGLSLIASAAFNEIFSTKEKVVFARDSLDARSSMGDCATEHQ
jgi:hypothetical protein